MKYLGMYNVYCAVGDTVSEVHEDISDEYGQTDVSEIDFYQLTPIEVECKTTYTIKPQF